MNNNDVSVKLKEIFLTEAGIEITDMNTNVFSAPYALTPRRMAGVLIAIKQGFGIDLKDLIPHLNNFTIAQIESVLSGGNN